jgi:outer membrane protein TolC
LRRRSGAHPATGEPDGRLQLPRERFLDDEEFASAGIGVQWAFFDGGQSRKRASAPSVPAVPRGVAGRASLIDCWSGGRGSTSRRRAEARQVTADAVDQAEENLRIARERYGAGLGTQTQLLEAETLRVQALTNRDNSQLDSGLARLRLARAVGAL